MGFLLRVVQLAIVIAAALVIVITSSGSHYRDSVGVTDHEMFVSAKNDDICQIVVCMVSRLTVIEQSIAGQAS
uniref:Uncharacterized protein n=1 Tax=Oryza glaberrima TaxID=4538 RepID=I1PDN9_ORYGL